MIRPGEDKGGGKLGEEERKSGERKREEKIWGIKEGVRYRGRDEAEGVKGRTMEKREIEGRRME